MYKRILVPVDGSRFSEQILPHAAAIAGSTGAELMLFRGVEKEHERQQAAGEVGALAGALGAKSICVVTKDAAAAVVEEAGRVPATLVALCSHGRTGAMQAIFGSTALAILRACGAPVLVYRPESGPAAAAPKRIERIVLPLDGSEVSESMVAPAAALAKWLGAQIEVVSAVDPGAIASANVQAGDLSESSYVRACAQRIASERGVKATWEVLHGDPKEAIPAYVRDLGGGRLLAMTTHGRGALRSALAGSVAAACLREAGVPVFMKLP